MEKRRKLEEMSLEELWTLFPITLVPHSSAWAAWASEEIQMLRRMLKNYGSLISHIGSTAIPGICAKPIVDILVETPSKVNWDEVSSILKNNGYILMNRGGVRMSFNKGYTEDGYAEKVFHIHFHLSGDNDEILFRDFLRDNPSVAKDYEALKIALAPAFRNNRDGYTMAKTDFIKNILLMIKSEGKKDSVMTDIESTLGEKVGMTQINRIAAWCALSMQNKAYLWKMSFSDNRRISVNSLWVLTHLDNNDADWLRSLQSHIIVRLLSEVDSSKKRLYLQLLRKQSFDSEHPLTVKLLDYCFSKINSECEPYAVRCFSIYIAYEISKGYPELVAELEEYLNLMSSQSLSPGLRSALRQTRERIRKLKG